MEAEEHPFAPHAMGAAAFEQILGLPFFNGTAEEAVQRTLESGGLLVAPSGTCFERLLEDESYRQAMTGADLALPDSGLMVSLWRILRGRRVHRISGLRYLQELTANPAFRKRGDTIWVVPNERARERLLEWGNGTAARVLRDDAYVAPMYGRTVTDDQLLSLLEQRHPGNIVIGIGAGAQEKLGWFLRERASYRPAIHCIGGALGFMTGDQVAIPAWADRLFLGWFLRFLSQPRVFLPRLWRARVLPFLILRYGRQLPPLRTARR